MRCLTADDEPLALKRLGKLLREAGCEVVSEHPDGVSAMEWLTAHPSAVDALFLDIKMPGMDGLEMAQELRERYPVVFVTAWPEHAVDAFEQAAAHYLSKPLSPEKISHAVERVRSMLPLSRYIDGIPSVPLHVGKGREHLVPVTEIECFSVSDREIYARHQGKTFLVQGMRSLREVADAYPSERFVHVGRSRLEREN